MWGWVSHVDVIRECRSGGFTISMAVGRQILLHLDCVRGSLVSNNRGGVSWLRRDAQSEGTALGTIQRGGKQGGASVVLKAVKEACFSLDDG